MDLKFEVLDRFNVSEDVLQSIFNLGDTLRYERDPDEPHPDRELRRRLFTNLNPYTQNFEWLILDKEKVIGRFDVSWENEKSPSYEENKKYTNISIILHPSYRRKGIGHKALIIALQKIKDEKPETVTLVSEATLESGKSFLKKLGGKIAIEGAENRLYLRDVNWDLMDQWITEGRELAKQEGVTLKSFTNHCPDDVVEEYVSVYEETMNQQPLGDFDGKIGYTVESFREQEARFAKQNIDWYTMYTEEQDGHVSGLTEMIFLKEMNHKAMQNLTGVKKEYRGRKLGKWLKAEMLRFITDKYPSIKYISTNNATTNAPMLSINTRMGFKEFKREELYMIDFSDLCATYLA